MSDEPVLLTLTSPGGAFHSICSSGITTNGLYRKFAKPVERIQEAGTSMSGNFLYILVDNRLYLLTILPSSVTVERIGNSHSRFVNATFSAEENILLGLTMSKMICLFSTYPPMHIRSFIFEAPVDPVRFRYVQLQRRVEVTFVDGMKLLFEIPEAFHVFKDSPPIQISPMESLDVPLRDIVDIDVAPEEEQQVSEDGEYVHENQATDSIQWYAQQIHWAIPDLLQRQERVDNAFSDMTDRVLRLEETQERIARKNQTIQRRYHELIARVVSLTNTVTDTIPVLDEFESFRNNRDVESAVQCFDDVVNPAQAKEFTEMNLVGRLDRIKRAVEARQHRTFRY